VRASLSRKRWWLIAKVTIPGAFPASRLRQIPHRRVFVAPEVQRGFLADRGGAFEFADQRARFDAGGDDQALEDVSRAVVDIDLAAQVVGAGGIDGKPVVPESQDREHLAAEMHPQPGFLAKFALPRGLHPVTHFFGQKLKHFKPLDRRPSFQPSRWQFKHDNAGMNFAFHR
jgi:hypothetical protein